MQYYYDTPGLRYDSGATYDDSPAPQQKGHKMAKAKLGLGTLNPQETIELTSQIVTMMTGNANFATPNPPLATITTQKNTTNTSITAYDTSKAGTDALLVTRDANVTTLKNLLTQLVGYVENISGGGAAKIESAGMGVRASTVAPIGAMTQVLELVLSQGDFEGTLDVVWKPVRGAKSYEIQISADPPTGTSWAAKMTASKSSATLEGLTSGAKLWARVRAVGADNKPGPWSDPAVKVVP
jgi:hypothetical protein